MNEVRTTAGRDDQSLRAPAAGTAVRFPVDVIETDRSYVLVADLPGVKPEALEVNVERGQLSIHGRVEKTDEQGGHREFTLRDYYRVFTLADDLDTDHIAAQLRDGVLRLEVPKAAKAQTRKITVQAS